MRINNFSIKSFDAISFLRLSQTVLKIAVKKTKDESITRLLPD